MVDYPYLFESLPVHTGPKKNIPVIPKPVWTRDKARLIERYLNLFVMITRHGTYIDGFAGPQREGEGGTWAAELVLESKPAWLRKFVLVDNNRDRVDSLRKLKSRQPYNKSRTIDILHGDFNALVPKALEISLIRERTASFCLLDQRTFECHWKTVRTIAQYKKDRKIEIFYFFGTSWLDRAMSGLKQIAKARDWWGKDDFEEFLKKPRNDRPQLLAKRFRDELRYTSAMAWPIFDGNRRVMYHMIHASDHPEAPRLMGRAYEKLIGSPGNEQMNLEFTNQTRSL